MCMYMYVCVRVRVAECVCVCRGVFIEIAGECPVQCVCVYPMVRPLQCPSAELHTGMEGSMDHVMMPR